MLINKYLPTYIFFKLTLTLIFHTNARLAHTGLFCYLCTENKLLT